MTGLLSRSLASARPCADPHDELVDRLIKGVRTTWLVMYALRIEYADNPAAVAVLSRLAEVLPNVPTNPEETR